MRGPCGSMGAARALVLVILGGFERSFQEAGCRVGGTRRPAPAAPPDVEGVVAVARTYPCGVTSPNLS